MAYDVNLRTGEDFESFEIDKAPSICPHCHKNINPNILYGYQSASDYGYLELDILMACPDKHNCGKGFLAIYLNSYSNQYRLSHTTFGKPVTHTFNPIIQSISPSFIKIYNESSFAEQHKLLEICGVGYRKALEFLIKDYSKQNNPGKEAEIESKMLSNCINSYVTDDRIKTVAKRAVWLGNDETHYVRKWTGKDLQDLKKLIDLTLHWIEMEMLTKSFEDEMPEN